MLEERFYLYRPWIPVCKSIEAELVSRLEIAPPVLDIGCGDGLFAAYSFKDRVDVGLDCDEEAAREAKGRGFYKRLKVGDACRLPFKEGVFQTVVSICALEHIPDLGGVLSGVYRVLRRGGKFIFTVPSKNFGDLLFASRLLRLLGLKGLAARYGDRKNRRSGHIHIHNPSEWKEILEAEGFGVEGIDYIFPDEAVFLWSFLHSLVFRSLFLPFRLFRDLKIEIIDNALRSILRRSLSGWIKDRSGICSTGGGYLLIRAVKA